MVCAGVLALGGVAGAAPADEEALSKGRRAANMLVDTILEQQVVNVREKGAADALPQCYYQALTVGKEIEVKTGVRIRRTSSRLRNPRNGPDAYEKEALARFERYAKEGSMPSEEIRQDKVDGKPVYRYVRPIVMDASCLACHGEAKALSPEVVRTLEEKYPDDKAVGYKTGEFRGLVSAVIPAE
jgi:hypothetical protein